MPPRCGGSAPAGTIIVNADGSFGLFLSGAWAADGDSDAFNQIFYTQSNDGENWSVPTSVISTDYTFKDSVVPGQDSGPRYRLPAGHRCLLLGPGLRARA